MELPLKMTCGSIEALSHRNYEFEDRGRDHHVAGYAFIPRNGGCDNVIYQDMTFLGRRYAEICIPSTPGTVCNCIDALMTFIGASTESAAGDHSVPSMWQYVGGGGRNLVKNDVDRRFYSEGYGEVCIV